MSNKKFVKSVVSEAELVPLFNLGELYVSDFLKDGEKLKYKPCKLEIAFDPISKVAQLTEQPCSEAMWGSLYWYLSSTNPQMREALKDVAQKTIDCVPKTERKSLYLDIASNDGTLLSFVSKDFYKVGVDPSKYDLVENSCDKFINTYFSAETFFDKIYDDKARYVSCCAMFYDLDNPKKFLKDVYDVMEDDGIFTLQLSYTPLMLKQLEFSNICHEHLCYYNLTSLKYLFDRTGFIIKDVELNNVNGGSIRVYLQKDIAKDNFKSPADRDICKIRIESLLEWEEKNGFNTVEVYQDFYQKILDLKKKTVDFIKKAKEEGKTIWGLAASTKGNTLLQVFGLDDNLIDAIAEKQERKWGLKTIGSNILIKSEEEFRKAKPDYCLILSWAFGESFKQREKEYLKNGTFIFPAPNFYLYTGKDNG